jgi:transcriptional regulator NrdR family protein
MTGRFSRFLNLERSRMGRGGEPAAPSEARSERFEALEGRAELPEQPPGAGLSADRFQDSGPGENLELAPARPGDQPFIRCAHCEADHGAQAQVCTQCGRDLTTAEQREFNEALWARRKKEAEEQSSELNRFREEAHQLETQQAAQRRAVAESMAREVAAQTRWRLENEERQERGRHGAGGLDIVGAVLDRLSARGRLVAFAFALGIPVLLLAIRSTRPLGLLLVVIGIGAYLRRR